MGRAWQIIGGFTTAVDTTLTALTMFSGDTLTIPPLAPNSKAWLLNLWADHQTAGHVRVRSSKFHDNVEGIRVHSVASEVRPLLPWDCPQELYPVDTLTVQNSGSNTAGDIESVILMLYYEDLPGITQTCITYNELVSRRTHRLMTLRNTLNNGTSGGWSGGEALNAEETHYRAGTRYALIGYHTSTEQAAISWKGTETGNLRVGGPGNELEKELTGNWFVDSAKRTGLPLIPVFDLTNAGAITVECAQDENGTDPLVTSIFAELR